MSYPMVNLSVKSVEKYLIFNSVFGTVMIEGIEKFSYYGGMCKVKMKYDDNMTCLPHDCSIVNCSFHFWQHHVFVIVTKLFNVTQHQSHSKYYRG